MGIKRFGDGLMVTTDMKITNHLRYIQRRVDINETILVLQQWWAGEPWEHPDYINTKGEWRDVPIVNENETSVPEK